MPTSPVTRVFAKPASITANVSPNEEASATLALLQGAQLLAKAAYSDEAFDQALVALKACMTG